MSMAGSNATYREMLLFLGGANTCREVPVEEVHMSGVGLIRQTNRWPKQRFRKPQSVLDAPRRWYVG